MRTVEEIYEKYRIPPWLQLHQLRVAAVGKTVSTRIPGTDVTSVIGCCLFHDMGNILKFDLSPDAALASMVPDGERDYWAGVQKDFLQHYGTDEHQATKAIATEVGLPPRVQELIGAMGFSKAAAIAREGRLELCVVEYADQRVGPHGVLSLEGRLADGNKRYHGQYGNIRADERGRYAGNVEGLFSIERRLMELSGMRPEDIHDGAIAPIIEELKNFEV